MEARGDAAQTAEQVRTWAGTQLAALESRIAACRCAAGFGGGRVIEGVLRLTAAGLFDAGWATERGLTSALVAHGAYAEGVTQNLYSLYLGPHSLVTLREPYRCPERSAMHDCVTAMLYTNHMNTTCT
jgi:hypothetical protein